MGHVSVLECQCFAVTRYQVQILEMLLQFFHMLHCNVEKHSLKHAFTHMKSLLLSLRFGLSVWLSLAHTSGNPLKLQCSHVQPAWRAPLS